MSKYFDLLASFSSSPWTDENESVRARLHLQTPQPESDPPQVGNPGALHIPHRESWEGVPWCHDSSVQHLVKRPKAQARYHCQGREHAAQRQPTVRCCCAGDMTQFTDIYATEWTISKMIPSLGEASLSRTRSMVFHRRSTRETTSTSWRIASCAS